MGRLATATSTALLLSLSTQQCTSTGKSIAKSPSLVKGARHWHGNSWVADPGNKGSELWDALLFNGGGSSGRRPVAPAGERRASGGSKSKRTTAPTAPKSASPKRLPTHEDISDDEEEYDHPAPRVSRAGTAGRRGVGGPGPAKSTAMARGKNLSRRNEMSRGVVEYDEDEECEYMLEDDSPEYDDGYDEEDVDDGYDGFDEGYGYDGESEDGVDMEEYDEEWDEVNYYQERSGSRGSTHRGGPQVGRGATRTAGRGRGRGGRRMGRGRGRGRPPVSRIAEMRKKLAGAQEDLMTRVSGAKHKGQKVLRELRGSMSSELEKTLIKATRPDNNPAKRKHVNLLLAAAERSFPEFMDPRDVNFAQREEGPYWMTLHKLWRRMAEKDYRTKAKALYVIHRLARSTSPESWEYFRKTLANMRRTEDPRFKSSYFSRQIIGDVDDEGQMYSPWLEAYGEFALLRMQALAPDLAELALVDAETKPSDSARVMDKAKRLIHASLACGLSPDIENDVTADCLKLVVDDLCELWALFQDKLEMRLKAQAEGGLSDEELEQTLHFTEFYLQMLEPAGALVRDSHHLLAQYSLATPAELGKPLPLGVLQQELTSMKAELGAWRVAAEEEKKLKAATAPKRAAGGRGHGKGSGGGARKVKSASSGSRAPPPPVKKRKVPSKKS